ncbi:MAG: DUF4007 family protein [Planctomycetota bacterium]
MRRDGRDRTVSILSFSGHETFVFRYGWLKKAVDAVRENPSIFTSEDAMVVLGVGKNMVRSIRHWGLAAGVLDEEPRTRGARLKPAELGEFLFGERGQDPYLEEPNSLWLLHWKLASSERRSTAWCWAFNLFGSNEFTRDSLTALIQDELRRRNLKPPSDHSLRRDVDCLVRCYTAPKGLRGAVLEDTLDCPLVELHLLYEDASGVFAFRRGFQTTLGDEAFVYALVDFWNRVAPGRESLAFSQIAYACGSPGNAFKLDENSLIERLERLQQVTQGRLEYTETAGLKQVYRHGDVPVLDFLARYYEHSDPRVEIGD